ncbi:RNA polymerase subunit sigma-24 [Nonomuraea basaltis]|uniref:RNA polymerase subunit sigma-24 n=1 Tax=Nonomuraea basaltis TaxID=2495887 RepID=UPI00110C6499|nr:RNA polymerase subunit sigma-24 [Nonomuraea basaltis]TMR90837.1 RNA polymerase subunit sigma-24 [Nonomuraea basaltis]
MHAESLEQASALEQAASAFVELRPRLFGITYRMLGSAAEAEDILQLTPVNVRQLVSRARKHLTAVRREPIDKIEHRRLLAVSLAAAQTGNVAALEDLFAADVVSSSDGGGLRGAARFPLMGSTRVVRFIAAFAPRFWPGADFTWVEVNGRAGVLVPRGRTGVTLLTIEASPQGIHHLMWIVNPAKLDAFARSRSRGRHTPDRGEDGMASQTGRDRRGSALQ